MQDLSKIYDDWENKLDKDEWYFSNMFEQIIDSLSAVEAYNYIPTIINELIRLRQSYLIGETLDFLHSVYNRADSTEIHPVLKIELKNIEYTVRQYGDGYSENALFELIALLRMENSK